MKMRILLPLLAVVSVSACEPGLDAPHRFFEKNKIGMDSDYGIIKFGDPTNHVATVHGFVDDHASCKMMVAALNADACKDLGGTKCSDPFSCIKLN